MAKVNNNRATPVRADKEFQKIIKQVMAKNLMRGKYVKTPRVTRAIYNQYKKYPWLLKELEEADLK